MRAFRRYYVIIGVVGVSACQQSVEPPALRALERSGKTSLLCREVVHSEGRDMRACPDSDDAVSNDEERHTMALVTQTLRGEVAVIDLHEEKVVDEDPYVPGTEFLQVGANPTAIVSTPGGVATFIGTGEPGLEAIYALPTTCIMPPSEGERTRDISLWSSCRLPSAPGEMLIAVDTTATADAAGTRTTCAPSTATEWIAAANLPLAERRTDCPANLELERQTSPVGRRKLVVTLPDRGQIAIYDAQAILNLAVGSFGDCVPDRVISLTASLPSTAIEQPVPDDLIPAAGSLVPPTRYTAIGYDESNVFSKPAEIALAGSTLYVADLNVPLIHTVDLSDPCSAAEGEPLRPLSYTTPGDAVFANHIAASDLLPSGKRYLYASVVKENSVMAFDISPGATSKAPILRKGTTELPDEPPDRIKFQSPVNALSLVTHDVPAVNSSTNIAEMGVLCDPHPNASAPGSLYRTNADYDAGAGPRKLRGLFGVAALANGLIAAIDIEDWDAPCRRPVTNNPNPNATDWLGCAHDPSLGASRYEHGSTPTVTGEESCRVFEPHRIRSGKYFLNDNDFGANAPNLSSFPLLTGGEGASLSGATVDRDRISPKMLAVAYDDVDCGGEAKSTLPFTFVGTTKYEACANGQTALNLDPQTAAENSLILPMRQPRVYSGSESFTATYEGVVLGNRPNGQMPIIPKGEVIAAGNRSLADDELVLRDTEGAFCDQGIQDYDVNIRVAEEMQVAESAKSTFAKNHGDFVVLMSDFSDTNPYFAKKETAKSCGQEDPRAACEDWFGTAVDPTALRELSIREAYHNQLIVTPRAIGTSAQKTIERIRCCFPAELKYEVRAAAQWVVKGSYLLNDIVAGEGLRCVKDGRPLALRKKSRAFEISSAAVACEDKGEGIARPDCFIGPAVKEASDEVCVLDEARGQGGVTASELGSVLPKGCVFDSLKSRFAIYRGLQPSVRDMSFGWSVNGGFSVLVASLVSASAGISVNPVNMTYARSLDALVVIDGTSGGFNLFGLGSFASLGQPYQ